MAADRIRLTNMRFYGHHGWHEEERRLGQHISIDVELAADLAAAGRADDLFKTIDYGPVYDTVKEIEGSGPFKLLEAMAERIAQALLERFPAEEVVVRVRKEHPPVGGLVDHAEVEVTRRRT